MSRALIVDDSKTAQARLKAMLKRYDLTVDIAFSAEEALGYLSYNQPSLIFLDHHMEGMDGLEALKIIKNNPSTAMIPVIMYTSEKGDLYVGQARALGALDILSKEIIHPSNLERVLENLKITPADEKPNQDEEGSAESDNSAQSKPTPISYSKPLLAENEDSLAEDLKGQIARLFEIHISDVRQQISDNSRFIVRNLRTEINKNKGKPPNESNNAPIILSPEPTPESGNSLVSGSLLVIILMGIAFIGLELYKSRQEVTELNKSYQFLIDNSIRTQESLSSLSEALILASEPEFTEREQFSHWLSSVNWAMDTDLSFNFNQDPLSITQVKKIQELVLRLAHANFEGIVELNIVFANVCLDKSDIDTLSLAKPEAAIQDCAFLAEIEPVLSISDFMTLDYIQFEQSADPLITGQIELSLQLGGISSFAGGSGNIQTAGDWNTQALKDNRIKVRLIPN